MDHIAAQLFLDVIQFAVIKDVRRMRNPQEVKQFWSVGQTIFRSKFLRFMCGYKTFSQLTDTENAGEKVKVGKDQETIMCKTDISMINFACSHKKVLLEEKKKT